MLPNEYSKVYPEIRMRFSSYLRHCFPDLLKSFSSRLKMKYPPNDRGVGNAF